MEFYKFKTVNIKGRPYVCVSERVKYFRAKYPDWTIRTELKRLTPEDCAVKAEITDTTGRVIADGLAYELKDSSFINKTSYVENCQTSAIGRAMAFLGIGIDDSIASSQEVYGALAAQDNLKKGAENGTKTFTAKESKTDENSLAQRARA